MLKLKLELRLRLRHECVVTSDMTQGRKSGHQIELVALRANKFVRSDCCGT